MNDKFSKVCIVGGLGHVGLPLGLMIAHCGLKVTLYDINQESIDTVSQGKMPFIEEGAENILREVLNKNLFVSSNRNVIRENYFIIVVIGTPVDEHLNPKFTVFKKFFDDIIDVFQNDQHLILRSTVFPGSTEKIQKYLSSKGKNPKISFCPERIAEGKAIKELRELPQIVSSFDKEAAKEAAELFSRLNEKILFLDPIEAELAKLFNNVWRYIQFATANQFYQIATKHGLDFYKIYDAVTYNYPRAKSFPKAGFAAGPCLFKDTMQLAAFDNNHFFLGHSAMLINEGLPNFIVQRLKRKYDLSSKNIGILGMAFKANSDDKRESLSYKLKKILEIESKKVLCTDVYIQEEEFVSPLELIEKADIIILGAAHKEYLNLDIDSNKILVDIWDFYGQGGNF